MHSTLVRRLVEVLEVSGSNYFSGFRSIFRDVIEALAEAQNMALYLKPFASLLENIEKVQDIESLSLHFDRLFHTIALSWANSVYYTNTNRFIEFLQQWTNFVILKVYFRYYKRKDLVLFSLDSGFTASKRFIC